MYIYWYMYFIYMTDLWVVGRVKSWVLISTSPFGNCPRNRFSAVSSCPVLYSKCCSTEQCMWSSGNGTSDTSCNQPLTFLLVKKKPRFFYFIFNQCSHLTSSFQLALESQRRFHSNSNSLFLSLSLSLSLFFFPTFPLPPSSFTPTST